MRILRWIFGIPLAVVISLGLLTIGSYVIDPRLYRGDYNLYFLVHAGETLFSFTLLVFLSCLFSPSPKKYAALCSTIIMMILIGIGLFVSLTKKAMGDFTIMSATSILSSIAGLSIGVILSYFIFKNKGWYPKPKITDSEILETY